jgi:hypothetical protein
MKSWTGTSVDSTMFEHVGVGAIAAPQQDPCVVVRVGGRATYITTEMARKMAVKLIEAANPAADEND